MTKALIFITFVLLIVTTSLHYSNPDIRSVWYSLDINQYNKLKELSRNNFRSVNDTSRMIVIKYLEEIK
jgi:hypothetical protein